MTSIGLNCFSCGAPAEADARKCGHCGTRLTTVTCPACHGMLFAGSKHCPHCGSAVMQWESEPSSLLCPACDEPMAVGQSGQVRLHECGRCFGFWVDAAGVEELKRNVEQQAAVLTDIRLAAAQATVEERVQYRRCPHCREFMNRVNFGRYSGVIVDVCREHGTWFDDHELRRVVEFIRGGGLDLVRQRQQLDWAAQQQRHNSGVAPAPTLSSGDFEPDADYDKVRGWVSLGAGAVWLIAKLLSK